MGQLLQDIAKKIQPIPNLPPGYQGVPSPIPNFQGPTPPIQTLPYPEAGLPTDVPRGTADSLPQSLPAVQVETSSPDTPATQPQPYETSLTPQEEQAFAQWKQQYAPRDSGQDYDLRGAFKAGLQPDPQTGHWSDQFKKPNHPTFSNLSQYAVGADAAKAGSWNGDQFIPPQSYTPPLGPPVPQPPAAAPPAGAVQPPESLQLAAQLQKLNAPPSTKDALIKAVMAFAPSAIAGLTGGLPAAAGAAQGTAGAFAAQSAEQDQEKKSLIAQMEAARGREQQYNEFDQTLTENKAKLAQERQIAQNLETGRNARSADTITGADRRAGLLQDAENERQRKLLENNGPGARTPAGIKAATDLATAESTIPQRPQGVQQPVAGRDVPLPAAVATQREDITRAGKNPPADQTTVATVDDPANPGKQKLVVIDKRTLQSQDVSGSASKTTAGQSNAAAAADKSNKEMAASMVALEKLAKQNTYAADQAMADQFFNIIKPGSGARMNEASIQRLLTPGPLMDKMTVWAQKLSKGQPLDAAARQDLLNAAHAVVEAKQGGAGPVGGAKPPAFTLPNGTVVHLQSDGTYK